MEIQADNEGQQAIRTICDAALKAAGLGILNVVNTVIAKTRPLPPIKEPDGQKQRSK